MTRADILHLAGCTAVLAALTLNVVLWGVVFEVPL